MHLCQDPSEDCVPHLVLHGLENLSLTYTYTYTSHTLCITHSYISLLYIDDTI